MMSLKLLLVSLASASALVIPGTAPAHAARCASPTMEGIINESIDKDSPKVATMLKVSEIEGKKGVMCRCWKSGTFPYCDAKHVEHNKATGDNVGPLIIDKD